MNEAINQPDQEISLRDVYMILKRNAQIILITPIVFAVLAAIYAFFIAESVYKSEANLTIQTTPVQSKIEDKIETASVTVFTSDQIETVATSRPILDGLIQTIQNSSHAPTNWLTSNFDAETLEKQLKVKFPKASGSRVTDASLVTLEVSAPDPRLAAEVANAWADKTNAALNLLPQQRVKDSIATLQGEIDRAGNNLNAIEKTYREYAGRSNLALDQQTLSNATTESASLEPLIQTTKQNVLRTDADLRRRSADLSVSAQAISDTTQGGQSGFGVTSNGQTLSEVRRNLRDQVALAKNRLDNASQAQKNFNASNDSMLLSGRISQNEARLLEINTKLQSFDSTLKTLGAQLQQARSAIKDQPQLLTLERELLSDPVISAAVQSRDPQLNNLIGLKLQNQESNPVYVQLLQTTIGLQQQIRTITAEQQGIKPEAVKRQTQLSSDRSRLAALRKQADPITLEVSNAQRSFEIVSTQYSRLSDLTTDVLTKTRIESTNPEYQRLRTIVNDLSADLQRSQVSLSGYESRAQQLRQSITQLKNRVASSSLESARIAQNLELTREQYKTLSLKLIDLKIEQASSKSLAQVLVPAFAPTRPAQGRTMIVLLAAVAGLLIGLIVPFILTALQDPNATVPRATRLSAPVFAAED